MNGIRRFRRAGMLEHANVWNLGDSWEYTRGSMPLILEEAERCTCPVCEQALVDCVCDTISTVEGDGWQTQSSDPLSDIQAMVEHIQREGSQAWPRSHVTMAEVLFLQEWARSKGKDVPEIQPDGTFLGKVVI